MLKDKIAIVTGATQGIGKAITIKYLENNARVFGIGRNTEVLESISKEWSNFTPCPLDICDSDAAKALFMDINKTQGHIDILVNNAGIMDSALIGMITETSIVNIFQTNVFALINLSQLAARFMKRQKNGCIINLASIVGIDGNVGQSVYSASKGAVIAFTKTAAKELASDNIRVNAIAPGIIETNLISSVKGEELQKRIDKIRLGRTGTPDDVANTALFLASPQSSYITGQIIRVDGLSTL